MTAAEAGPTTNLAAVVAAMNRLYPPDLAEQWDAVGLIAGRPEAQVTRILVAVDPVADVAAEAIEWGADLLITHHPLFLSGVNGVAATDAKGTLLTDLIQAGCALFNAHTNADAAAPGVSDALAEALGLIDLEPLTKSLDADPAEALVVFVPPEGVESLVDAMAATGAGRVGAYSRCAFLGSGQGTFEVPEDGRPHFGAPGAREVLDEVRVEVSIRRSQRSAVLAGMLTAHPYEQPAYFVYPVADTPRLTGIGRLGRLPAPATLAEFATVVAEALPGTAHGIRVAGDPTRMVNTVAVCGGAGDSLLAAAAGADAFVTADLRHHRASEHLADGGAALVDVGHWASEWPWCSQVASLLPGELASPDSVDIRVSTTVTDPWTFHLRSTT